MLPTLNARGEWVVVEHVSQLAASIKGNEVCARTSAALQARDVTLGCTPAATGMHWSIPGLALARGDVVTAKAPYAHGKRVIKRCVLMHQIL